MTATQDCVMCDLAGCAGDRFVDSILIHRHAVTEAETAGLTHGDVFYQPDVYRAWHGRNELEAELRRLASHRHMPANVIDLTARRRKGRQ